MGFEYIKSYVFGDLRAIHTWLIYLIVTTLLQVSWDYVFETELGIDFFNYKNFVYIVLYQLSLILVVLLAIGLLNVSRKKLNIFGKIAALLFVAKDVYIVVLAQLYVFQALEF